MTRAIGLALWVSLVVAGVFYVSAKGNIWGRIIARQDNSMPEKKIDSLKTRQISIPIIRDGEVAGYVLLKFAATYPAAAAKSNPIGLEALLIDEAHSVVPSFSSAEIVTGEPRQLQAMTNLIVERLNKRGDGVRLIDSLLIQEFSYVGTKEARR